MFLKTFELLEQKQSCIPPLKVLMCGMNGRGAKWHYGIIIFILHLYENGSFAL